MARKLSPADGEPFIAAMERARVEESTDPMQRKTPTSVRMIAPYMHTMTTA